MSSVAKLTDVAIVCRSLLLRQMLASTCELDGMQVIDCRETADGLSSVKDDTVVILHISSTDGDLDASIERLYTLNQSVRIVLLSNSDPVYCARSGITDRISGLVSDHYASEILTAAIRLVAAGFRVQPCLERPARACESAVSSEDSTLPEKSRLAYDLLTKREIAVLARLRDGQENKGIAIDLGMSEATVKVHLRALFRKTGARNRTQAALWAARHL